MSKYIISCCTPADLTREHLESRDIKYIYFHYELDGKQYEDDLGLTMTMPEFYKAMVDGADTKTSQVNSGEFEEFFSKYLDEGYDIIHMTLSSGISGVYNSACIARDELSEKYPDRKIYIVDSLAAACGYGLLMDKIADMRDSGMDVDQLHEWIEENKSKVQHWFFSMDLTFFIKGGRISKTAGAIGNILNICPFMDVEPDGSLAVKKKLRGKKKAFAEMISTMKELAENGESYDDKIYIAHSACEEDVKIMTDMVAANFPKASDKIVIGEIGPTIGSHTGPGTVVVCFWGAPRVPEDDTF